MARPKKKTKKTIVVKHPGRNALLWSNYKHNRLVLGMTRMAAAIKAGYSYQTAWKKGFLLDRRQRVGITVPEAFSAFGMDDINYVKGIIEKTKATKIQNCRLLIRRDADGKPKIEQNADDFIEVDDNQTQMRAFELIGDWKKLEYTRKLGIVGAGSGNNMMPVQININLGDGEIYRPESHTPTECGVSVAVGESG